ncbi:hypothetical protein MNBD_GAMMA21-14 [hydrothermal vent metagenome]|uniref:Uncharacterized protein n=1 Tax=hydrothermal vent metagenome TaxID=652676 RepID=A0A3B0ZR58_9ZZZZ
MSSKHPPSQDSCNSEATAPTVRKIIPAMSTPLASIFGSGFLVVVPILASAVGPYSILAMGVVAVVAFLVGAIIRHNILCAEPVLLKGDQRFTVMVERLSDFALVAAYVVSVCLYIHILSSFVLSAFGLDSSFNNSLLTTIIIGVITVIGLFGGLKPLENMERWALYVTMVLLLVLLILFGIYDIKQYVSQQRFSLPDMPPRTAWEIITIVAGTLIIVQGFETTRYLGGTFDAATRIRASRWSQYFSLSIYVIFVALALPIVSVLNGNYNDNSLITIAATASLLLPLPLIVAASLSQFSAAVADTLAAAANMQEASQQRIGLRWGYLFVGSAAMALAWSGSTFEIIVLASRAFAFYYLLQCLVAFSVCRNHFERIRFIFMAFILAFVLLFAVPAA